MRTRRICKKLESSLILPQFQMCCVDRQAMLASLRDILAEARGLLIRNDAIAKEFKNNTTKLQSSIEFHLHER